jgi:SAM-dependent methyltransferase
MLDTWQVALMTILVCLIAYYCFVVITDRLTSTAPIRTALRDVILEEGFADGIHEDIYDKFYATVYSKIFQHDNLVQAETGILLTEWRKGKKESEMRVLDVCCGTGVATCAFVNQGVDKAVGLDKSVAMLNYAKDVIVPATTLKDDQKQRVEWRIGDAYAPMAASVSEFTHACLLFFSIYQFQDLNTLFKNLTMWIKPGGGLAIEVVNKFKFEPIPDVANPWLAVSPQKYSKDRIVNSQATFDTFDYETEFQLYDPVAEFKETFTVKEGGKVRQQKHTLYMPSIDKIVHTAVEQGFHYDKFMDLQFTGFNYGYMLFFTRVLN